MVCCVVLRAGCVYVTMVHGVLCSVVPVVCSLQTEFDEPQAVAEGELTSSTSRLHMPHAG